MLTKAEKIQETKKQFITILNYAAIYVLAYFTAYLANLFATLAAANYFDIPAVLYTGHINFKIAEQAWGQTNVVITYAAGPLLCLLLSAISYSLFTYNKFNRGLAKVYFLWMYLISANFFFGSLIAGTIVKSGFWYAARWLVTDDTLPSIMAIIFLLVIIVIGVVSAPGFLFACDSKTLMRFKNREKMLYSTVFAPWFIGSLVIMLVKYPDNRLYELLQFVTLGVLLIPVYIVNQNTLFTQVVREPAKTLIAWGIIIVIALFAVVFKLALHNGLSFGS